MHVSLVGAIGALRDRALSLDRSRRSRQRLKSGYTLQLSDRRDLALAHSALPRRCGRTKTRGWRRLGCIPAALRPAWFWAHRLIAPTVLTVAAATIFVGADLMHDRYGTRDSTGVSFLRPGVLGGAYAAARRRRRLLLRPDETTRGVDERPRTRVNPSRSFIHILVHAPFTARGPDRFANRTSVPRACLARLRSRPSLHRSRLVDRVPPRWDTRLLGARPAFDASTSHDSP